jgi:predicted Zn-dependent protease
MPPPTVERVELVEEQSQVALRGGSPEHNLLQARVAGVRVRVGGCTATASVQLARGEPDWRMLEERALKLARLQGGSCRWGLASATLYRGSVRLGSGADVDPLEAVEIARQHCEGGSCEASLVRVSRLRRIEHAEGEAVEEKTYYIVEAAVEHGGAIGASRAGSLLFDGRAPLKALSAALDRAWEEARALARAKPLSPLEAGRARLILSAEATAALLHELSHLLDPDYAGREMRGLQIASPNLTVYDDPRTPLAPSARFFDDEAVVAARRTLVEDGRVVDMHFTRRTAWRYRGRPGSAYGLFTTPTGFHTTLVMEPGDWRLEEMVEEVRRGVYIATVAAAFAERGLVRLVPRLAFRVKGRDLEPLKLREVKIPLRSLHTVTAVGRAREARVSLEKGEWLVAEIAAPLILEAYIA